MDLCVISLLSLAHCSLTKVLPRKSMSMMGVSNIRPTDFDSVSISFFNVTMFGGPIASAIRGKSPVFLGGAAIVDRKNSQRGDALGRNDCLDGVKVM